MTGSTDKDSSTVRTVVVATDFSPAAAVGVDWGRAVAASHEARLVLLHGLEWPEPTLDHLQMPLALVDQARRYADERLADAQAALAEQGLAAETLVESGRPAQVICDVARRLAADLVVIGTRGETGLASLLIGSTAVRVVQHAPCAVLVVHPEDVAPAGELDNVLVATDFSKDADAAASMAIRVFDPSPPPATITLLHVHHVPGAAAAFGPQPTGAVVDSYVAAASAVLRDNLEAAAEPLRAAGREVQLLLRDGRPADAIAAAAEDVGAQVIALGARGRSGFAHFLGSVAERVVQTAPCPVLQARATYES